MGSSNVTIRNNLFQDVGATAVITSANAEGPVTSKHMSIYGKVFWQSQPDTFGTSNGVLACINGNVCSEWQFTNNTIVNFTGPGSYSGRVRFDQASPLSGNNVARNDIWFNSINVYPSGPSVQHDHNSYFMSTEAPSEIQGQSASIDPFVDSEKGDFRLKVPTSPGLVLPAPFAWDSFGKRRGYDGIWDRGAFEF